MKKIIEKARKFHSQKTIDSVKNFAKNLGKHKKAYDYMEREDRWALQDFCSQFTGKIRGEESPAGHEELWAVAHEAFFKAFPEPTDAERCQRREQQLQDSLDMGAEAYLCQMQCGG